ncbi:T9SS type A sorting domain-containing protein [Costertonia aggregata]|uniref:T9SS type A sorting domain-containing protein n=1 Tax=Costertonia aggregata TaxID=343403 RepID=A0A7H9AQI7_9FLAO|nr:T9SS type A sorting domain-containing protein [Costertonia aggregata]QLG45693.1 T9SS type A sorting domain-containing protein [Costertonia aggregata]
MKLFYSMLFLALTFHVSAQDELAFVDYPKTEIETGADFKIYPNPAYGDIVHVSTKLNNTKDIVVYDVFGEVVLKDRIATSTLNISKLVPGVYVLQVTENKKTLTRKLIVK